VTRPPRILQADRVEAHASFRTTQHSRPHTSQLPESQPSSARPHQFFDSPQSIHQPVETRPGRYSIQSVGWRFSPVFIHSLLLPHTLTTSTPSLLSPACPLALRAPIGPHRHPRRTRLTRSSTPTDPPRALDIPVPYLALLRYVRSFDSPPFLPNHVRL
jgi:hypothetical protein